MWTEIIETDYKSTKDLIISNDWENANTIIYHRFYNYYSKCNSKCNHDNFLIDELTNKTCHDIAKIINQYVCENKENLQISVTEMDRGREINVYFYDINYIYTIKISDLSYIRLLLYYWFKINPFPKLCNKNVSSIAIKQCQKKLLSEHIKLVQSYFSSDSDHYFVFFVFAFVINIISTLILGIYCVIQWTAPDDVGTYIIIYIFCINAAVAAVKMTYTFQCYNVFPLIVEIILLFYYDFFSLSIAITISLFDILLIIFILTILRIIFF